MKNVKSVLCVLLTIVISLGFTVQAFAANISTGNMVDNNDIEEILSENFGLMLDSVLRRDEMYGISVEDFDGFAILNPVSFSTFYEEPDDLVSVLHFPIADKTGEICLIYDVIFTNNGYSTTIGADFAPLLNSLYKDGIKNIVLIQDENTFYAVGNSVGYVQQGSNIASMKNSDFEKILAYNINLSTMKTSSLTVNAKFSTLAENSFSTYIADKMETNSSAVIGAKSLNNYPIVNQVVDGKQYGLCWAATVASIVRFEKPSQYGNLTAKNVADYMGIGYDDGGTNSEAKEALEHYLGSPYVPTIKNAILTQEQIKTAIDNIDPAFMQCRRPNGFLSYKYHAVALTGYDFTSNYTRIEIMDPAYACFKYCTMDSGGNWTFAFGSYTYTWIKTIRLLYS